MKDPYAVLGVARDASDEDIQKAYRSMARKWHPDMHLDPEAKEKAQEKFKEVSAAYEILNDKQKRMQFDQFGARGGPNVFHGHPFGGHWKPFSSMMDDFWGWANRERETRGEHITVEQEIMLDQVLNGGDIEIKYHQHRLCPDCGGVGGEVVTCSQCQGSGARVIHGPQMTVRTPCPVCGGAGKTLGTACGKCSDGRVGPEELSVVFHIPKGVESGMRFVFSGKGEPSPEGQPGNLYVIVKVKPHDIFERLPEGGLIIHYPVTYTQLVLGCELKVPTLEGKAVVKVPAGTQDRTKFRLRGQGLPVFQRQGDIYKRGDQIVECCLEIPTGLSEDYRKVIEALAGFERSETNTGGG